MKDFEWDLKDLGWDRRNFGWDLRDFGWDLTDFGGELNPQPPVPPPARDLGSARCRGRFGDSRHGARGVSRGGWGASALSRHVPICHDIRRYLAIYRDTSRQCPPSGAYARQDSMAATILRSLESLSTNPSPFFLEWTRRPPTVTSNHPVTSGVPWPLTSRAPGKRRSSCCLSFSNLGL